MKGYNNSLVRTLLHTSNTHNQASSHLLSSSSSGLMCAGLCFVAAAGAAGEVAKQCNGKAAEEEVAIVSQEAGSAGHAARDEVLIHRRRRPEAADALFLPNSVKTIGEATAALGWEDWSQWAVGVQCVRGRRPEGVHCELDWGRVAPDAIHGWGSRVHLYGREAGFLWNGGPHKGRV